jgi:hypothetical protein
MLLGACAQILGLNDYQKVPAESSSGKGGAGGAGGRPPTGGTAGAHAPGSAGSEEAGRGQAGGGAGGCGETIEITVRGMPSFDPRPADGYYSYEYNVDPQLDTAAGDYLWIDFYTGGEYTGDETGVFELGTGDDVNYASCSRCVWFGVDVGDSGNAKAYFFAKSGRMDIAADSKQLIGLPDVELTDVLLSEVELDMDTHVSTEIPGGRCLHLASASLVIESKAPAAWTCPDYAYGAQDGCDCGCGVADPDCASELVGACDYCDDQGSCASDCSDIKLTDNAQCGGANQGWTCDPQNYGDGSICDCGCGIVDYDCPGKEAKVCGLCDDPKSCTAQHSGTCADIAVSDNSRCK